MTQLLRIFATGVQGGLAGDTDIALVGWGLLATAWFLGGSCILCPSIEWGGCGRWGDVGFIGSQAPLVGGTRGIEMAVSRCRALVRHVSAETGLPNGWHLGKTQKSIIINWCITKKNTWSLRFINTLTILSLLNSCHLN